MPIHAPSRKELRQISKLIDDSRPGDLMRLGSGLLPGSDVSQLMRDVAQDLLLLEKSDPKSLARKKPSRPRRS